jgi:DNA polymerase gamma 1
MSHIVAPPGYKFVAADFVSQESRIATAIMTDCRAGKHHSSPWTESVLAGDKSKGTDVHSQTASMLGISRSDAKTINFNIQYGGGLLGISIRLALIKGITIEQATDEATVFLKRLKGKGGIAETTFSNLQFLAGTRDLRTYLLRVKQPNTINPRFLTASRDFTMIRGNHPIQSAGVDEKHVLITIIDILLQVRGLAGKAFFSNEIHDQIVYLAQEDVADKVAAIFDTAVAKLMELSYEQAALWWDIIDPLPDGSKRPVLKPDPKWCKFEHVSIADNLAGCK